MSGAIAINARAAARAEVGGVERWARELAARLPELRPGRYRVLRPPRVLAHRAGHAWEQALLPLAARDARALLSPANTAPLAAPNNVVLVHDAAALRHPEWYGRAFVAWQRRMLPLLARRSLLLMTVSEFSRAELLDVLGADPARLEVLPPGVDASFHPGADPEPARRAHGLERPYVLALGTLIARKNLPVLHQAGRRLGQEGIELVVAGSGRGYMREGRRPPGRLLGYVAERHLPGLYAGARAAVMPSLYEGFGLPCIEAMACGTPLVASTAAALPETCAGAALLVDPRDERGFADALLSATGDEEVGERLRRRGLERARQFGWERTAMRLDALLERL